MANFDADAINDIIDKITSFELGLAIFDSVNLHEPKSAPGTGITCSVWCQSIKPVPEASGLASTSGVVLFACRIYMPFTSQPYDMIDPQVMSATTDTIGELSGNFDFGGDSGVRALDLLGMYGTSISATAGYVEIDRKMFRIMTINIPVIVNDMWAQSVSVS
jgi:hypothetical protein